MNTEQLSNTKALEIIEDAIQKTKESINEDGFPFILWGWIVTIGNLLTFSFIKAEVPQYIGIFWAIAGIAGGIVTGIYFARKKKSTKVVTHLDSAISSLWISTLIGASIVYIYAIASNNFLLINPILFIIFGIATFATGKISKLKPLTIGGIILWVAAIACFLIQTELQVLIGALGWFAGYLIPGHVTRSIFNKENNA